MTSVLKLQSSPTLNTVLRLPVPRYDDKPARKEGLNALSADFSTRLAGYSKEIDPNAYAVLNTLTDIAARPPESPHFQRNRVTIEKRSGRWLKQLSNESHTTGFDLQRWLRLGQFNGILSECHKSVSN